MEKAYIQTPLGVACIEGDANGLHMVSDWTMSLKLPK